MSEHRFEAEADMASSNSGGVATVWAAMAVVLGVAVLLFFVLLPVTRSAGPAARRVQCNNHLRQIALALLNYESQYHTLPPAYSVDQDGQPLHSWRTLILPFLGEENLYRSIDLSKPWNHTANAVAFQREVALYRCPESQGEINHTIYLAVSAPDGCFGGGVSRALGDITDDHDSTLMVVEVSEQHAVPWMSPIDADENLLNELPVSSNLPHQKGLHMLFVDGHVAWNLAQMSTQKLHAMVTIAGGESVRQ